MHLDKLNQQLFVQLDVSNPTLKEASFSVNFTAYAVLEDGVPPSDTEARKPTVRKIKCSEGKELCEPVRLLHYDFVSHSNYTIRVDAVDGDKYPLLSRSFISVRFGVCEARPRARVMPRRSSNTSTRSLRSLSSGFALRFSCSPSLRLSSLRTSCADIVGPTGRLRRCVERARRRCMIASLRSSKSGRRSSSLGSWLPTIRSLRSNSLSITGVAVACCVARATHVGLRRFPVLLDQVRRRRRVCVSPAHAQRALRRSLCW